MLAAVYIRGAQNALKGPPGGIHAKQLALRQTQHARGVTQTP